MDNYILHMPFQICSRNKKGGCMSIQKILSNIEKLPVGKIVTTFINKICLQKTICQNLI